MQEKTHDNSPVWLSNEAHSRGNTVSLAYRLLICEKLSPSPSQGSHVPRSQCSVCGGPSLWHQKASRLDPSLDSFASHSSFMECRVFGDIFIGLKVWVRKLTRCDNVFHLHVVWCFPFRPATDGYCAVDCASRVSTCLRDCRQTLTAAIRCPVISLRWM